VNLPRDFHKAARRIQMLAGFVLRHRFDHRAGQTFAAELIQRPQRALDCRALPLRLGAFAVNQKQGLCKWPSVG